MLGEARAEGFASEEISVVVERLLEEKGWKITDLDLVAVGVGPGSYTGLRVGAAFAKGLNLATGVSLEGYCSLKAYLPPEGDASLFDARAGGVYVYDGGTSRVCQPEELLEGNFYSIDDELLRKRGIAVLRAEIQWETLTQNLGEGSDDLELLYLKGTLDRYSR